MLCGWIEQAVVYHSVLLLVIAAGDSHDPDPAYSREPVSLCQPGLIAGCCARLLQRPGGGFYTTSVVVTLCEH